MLDPERKLFRWGPISACPLYLYYTIHTSFTPMKELLGKSYPESLIIFKDSKATWLLDQEQFVETSREFVNHVMFDSQNKSNYFKLWESRTRSLLDYFGYLDKQDLTTHSDNELKTDFEKFSQIYTDWWTLTMSVELVTSSVEPMLAEKLKPYYPQEHPKDYNRAFSILTSPLVLTFYREEQRDLLEILNHPQDKHDELLKAHQAKYHWIYNSYLEAKVLTVAHFTGELAKFVQTDYQKILDETREYPDKIKKEKQEILNTIKPSQEVKDLIELAEVFSALQDTRKKHNFMADYYLENFVKEFAKRLGANPKDLKLLLDHELSESLENLDKNTIEKRRKCLVIECAEKDIDFIEGSNALAIADKFSVIPKLDQSIIHGMLASTGESYYFRGTARIILDVKDIDKLQVGEVLVTTMTSPDFVVGMKRAGAIVTDTGGILSHAAIVSRELKKACIVGTQIATKIIKDGDVVELHCGRGIIKVIKQNN